MEGNRAIDVRVGILLLREQNVAANGIPAGVFGATIRRLHNSGPTPGDHGPTDLREAATGSHLLSAGVNLANLPAEIRGEFQPIATRVPGMYVCEHLPQLAARAERYALVRSLSHGENNHLVVSGKTSSRSRTLMVRGCVPGEKGSRGSAEAASQSGIWILFVVVTAADVLRQVTALGTATAVDYGIAGDLFLSKPDRRRLAFSSSAGD